MIFQQYVDKVRKDTNLISSVKVDDSTVPRAVFMDTSEKALELLARAYIYLQFEQSKLSTKGLALELRRISSLVEGIALAGKDLLDYRERISKIAPELLETNIPEGKDS